MDSAVFAGFRGLGRWKPGPCSCSAGLGLGRGMFRNSGGMLGCTGMCGDIEGYVQIIYREHKIIDKQ